ncbi:MAG: AI-2E family transporter [Pseudomonadota bacterium]|nr:AI-2E family transporter [Desulfobacterales bacterium]MBL6966962.1 AI-2E family transporter [Desulfobacteraceae bacterium]
MEKKYGATLFLIFLICSLFLVLKLFWTYVSAIVLALLIASVFYPLYSWVKRVFREREILASLCMTFFLFLVLVIPVGWFIGTLSNEAYEFYKRSSSEVSVKQIQDLIEHDPVWAERFKKLGKMTGLNITPEAIEELAASIGKKVGLFLYSQLTSMASNMLSFLIHFFLMMMTIFYLFQDGARLKKYLIELMPVPKEQLEKVANKFQEMGKALIVGNGMSGIIQGIFGGFGFFFFGLGSPFLWGTVVTFMAFLPIVGATAVFVPATVILMIQGNTGLALGYLIYNLTYSSIVEYLVKPRLIGQGMQMNALLVFIGILGGIKLFGILGIIYGPLIITTFLTLAEIYRLEYRERAI